MFIFQKFNTSSAKSRSAPLAWETVRSVVRRSSNQSKNEKTSHNVWVLRWDDFKFVKSIAKQRKPTNQPTNTNFTANQDDAEIKMNQSDLKAKNVADAKRGKTLSSNGSGF